MPNYKCECPAVFSGDDAQRDRDIHMDSCEFRKIRIERDALVLQIEELKKLGSGVHSALNTACGELEAANRLNERYLKALARISSYNHECAEVAKEAIIEKPKCATCGGDGRISKRISVLVSEQHDCPDCTEKRIDEPCPECHVCAFHSGKCSRR